MHYSRSFSKPPLGLFIRGVPHFQLYYILTRELLPRRDQSWRIDCSLVHVVRTHLSTKQLHTVLLILIITLEMSSICIFASCHLVFLDVMKIFRAFIPLLIFS